MIRNEREYKEVIEGIAFIVSHKMRGPVATMQGLLELIRMKALDQDELCHIHLQFEACAIKLEAHCRELGALVYEPETDCNCLET